MLEEDTPDKVCVRSNTIYNVAYGFADASGKGFGSTYRTQSGTTYRIGCWSSDEGDENSSNWKELDNVVESLE